MDELRKQVDLIHDDLFKLFVRRIQLTEKIWIEKIQSNASYVDLNRENFLIHQHDDRPEFIENPEMKKAYHFLIEQLMYSNKEYLKKYIENYKKVSHAE